MLSDKAPSNRGSVESTASMPKLDNKDDVFLKMQRNTMPVTRDEQTVSSRKSLASRLECLPTSKVKTLFKIRNSTEDIVQRAKSQQNQKSLTPAVEEDKTPESGL